MSDSRQPPAAPAAFDVVEIIDRISSSRLSATVESANDRRLVLRLGRAAEVPEEAPVRWFDGSAAWQAMARLAQIDATHVSCELVSPGGWKPSAVRGSLRTSVGETRLLVRIASSGVLARGRRVHAVCLDASERGCRATWPGNTPLVGDAVDLMWDVGGRSGGVVEVGWVAALVTRTIVRSPDAREVCFGFRTTSSTQAARIRAWHDFWLQRHHQRPRDTAA